MHRYDFPSAIVATISWLLMILRFLHSMTASPSNFDSSEPKLFFDEVIEYPRQCLLSITYNDSQLIDVEVMLEATYLICAISFSFKYL